MKRITHGIAIFEKDDEQILDNIVHFVGFWNKPDENAFTHIKQELKDDPSHGLSHIAHELIYVEATQEIVDAINEDIFND